jgi:hypothetical protein
MSTYFYAVMFCLEIKIFIFIFFLPPTQINIVAKCLRSLHGKCIYNIILEWVKNLCCFIVFWIWSIKTCVRQNCLLILIATSMMESPGIFIQIFYNFLKKLKTLRNKSKITRICVKYPNCSTFNPRLCDHAV